MARCTERRARSAVDARGVRGYYHASAWSLAEARELRDKTKAAGVTALKFQLPDLLEWVETGMSSEESIKRGLVDLWPLMVDIPYRHAFVHFARPWVHSRYALLFREGIEPPGRDFRGRMGVVRLALHTRMMHDRFPLAESAEAPTARDVLASVCAGTVGVALLEARVALGQATEARSVASRYLARYPNGPLAHEARKVLGSGE